MMASVELKRALVHQALTSVSQLQDAEAILTLIVRMLAAMADERALDAVLEIFTQNGGEAGEDLQRALESAQIH